MIARQAVMARRAVMATYLAHDMDEAPLGAEETPLANSLLVAGLKEAVGHLQP